MNLAPQCLAIGMDGSGSWAVVACRHEQGCACRAERAHFFKCLMLCCMGCRGHSENWILFWDVNVQGAFDF